ncbi:MAG: 3-isopropylmalate dehydrogenase [Acidobacteria bacterium]|nr:MAG: 3-isopropylmalate dehydrogenase [Acidobacteriota bacterium]
MRLRVLLMPGDGIGPEVLREASKALHAVALLFGHTLEAAEAAIGGASIDKAGVPLTVEALAAAQKADATLLGAVGLKRYDSLPPERRPERGLLDLRKGLGVFANIRPSRTWPALLDVSPLKNDVANGAALVFVRELTSGIYYGTPRGVTGTGADERAVYTLSYTRAEIDRVARIAFDLARGRRARVTSVDKSNVLENSQLWRRVVTEVGREYPDVRLDHMLVDNCAMQLVLNPRQFDVVLTENMFGDILSDEAAVLAGSIGMLASASLGAPRIPGEKTRQGLYEPVHGSAPDIAGRGLANPLGAIGSVAAMLDYSFGLKEESAAVSRAIDEVVASGRVTPDLRPSGTAATTEQVGDAVCGAIAGCPNEKM